MWTGGSGAGGVNEVTLFHIIKEHLVTKLVCRKAALLIMSHRKMIFFALMDLVHMLQTG